MPYVLHILRENADRSNRLKDTHCLRSAIVIRRAGFLIQNMLTHFLASPDRRARLAGQMYSGNVEDNEHLRLLTRGIDHE